MARVQLIIPDEDRMQFAAQAQEESLSFSAWMRLAARRRVEEMQQEQRFRSVEELDAFFAEVHALHGADPGPEPDWEETKQSLLEALDRGIEDS